MEDDEKQADGPEESAPLPKGQPLSLEASIERMYALYGRTFEELAK